MFVIYALPCSFQNPTNTLFQTPKISAQLPNCRYWWASTTTRSTGFSTRLEQLIATTNACWLASRWHLHSVHFKPHQRTVRSNPGSRSEKSTLPTVQFHQPYIISPLCVDWISVRAEVTYRAEVFDARKCHANLSIAVVGSAFSKLRKRQTISNRRRRPPAFWKPINVRSRRVFRCQGGYQN